MNWKNKRKVEKGGIEALRSEFPVLTLPMMAMILGGDNKCVVDAIYVASECGGYGYTKPYIENVVMCRIFFHPFFTSPSKKFI